MKLWIDAPLWLKLIALAIFVGTIPGFALLMVAAAKTLPVVYSFLHVSLLCGVAVSAFEIGKRGFSLPRWKLVLLHLGGVVVVIIFLRGLGRMF